MPYAPIGRNRNRRRTGRRRGEGGGRIELSEGLGMELQEGFFMIELQWSQTKAELNAVTGRIGFSAYGGTEVSGLVSDLKCRITFIELDWSQRKGYV
jgi:hypothetical protein